MRNIQSFRYLYSKLPFFLKRGNRHYSKTRKLIFETEKLSAKQLLEWQFHKLVQIVNYSWNNIEGYREHWLQSGFEPSKLKTLDDVNLIPFIDKDTLRDNLDVFSNKILVGTKLITTGGSTGIPFGFYEQNGNALIERAFIENSWSHFYPEVNRNTKRVVLRGDRRKNVVSYDPIIGLILSSYDLNVTNVKLYLKKINRKKYKIFHGYPSAVYIMAKIMKDNNLRLEHNFEAIMLGSEPLFNFQQNLIEEVFKTNICHWYGHTEKAVFASNCLSENRFHVYPQYGLCEIVKNNGENANVGEIGEIVGTSFWNYVTPFIRYRTMDYAKVGNEGCEKCGRNYKILDNIVGRSQDFVVNSDKEVITLTALVFAQHFEAFQNIEKMQLEQEVIGEVIVKVIPTYQFSLKDEKEIIKKMHDASNGKISILIKRVESLEKTIVGKHKFFEQKLDVRQYL